MILKILLVIIGVFLGLVGSGFCQSAKARDTITMTLEDYKHMGEILHSLPIRERHKSLKGKDVFTFFGAIFCTWCTIKSLSTDNAFS